MIQGEPSQVPQPTVWESDLGEPNYKPSWVSNRIDHDLKQQCFCRLSAVNWIQIFNKRCCRYSAFNNVDFCLQFWHLLTILTNLIIFYNFENFDNFWNILTLSDNFNHFWQFWQLLTIWTIGQFGQFWPFGQIWWQSWRLVTFETLIKILTTENLNSWQSLFTAKFK